MSNADTDRRLGSLCGNGDLVMLRRMLSLNRMFERCWRTSRHRHPHQSNGMRAIRFLAAGAAHIASTMSKQLYRAVHRTDWRFGWIVAHFGSLLGRVVSNRLCRILERLPRVWSGTLCRIIDRGSRCTRLRTTQSAEALLDARVGGCHGFGLPASSPEVRRHPSPGERLASFAGLSSAAAGGGACVFWAVCPLSSTSRQTALRAAHLLAKRSYRLRCR